jgi:transcriptional regulator with XRE-family HTH domain
MAAERVPGGFGSKLREARERRGMSLRQIANATKISIGALEALESNQLSRLPGGIFSRAFVRSYAIEVGLDPDATIQEFIAQFPHDSLTAVKPTSVHSEDNEALESHRKVASAFLRLVSFSLPIVGVVLYYGAGRNWPGGNPAQVSQGESSAGPVESGGEAGSAVKPEPAGTSANAMPSAVAAPAVSPAAQTDLIKVGISAIAPCWVSTIVDGAPVIRRQLRTGDSLTLDVRRELVLTAGDAAALTVTLNGQDARPLGKTGQVVNTRINLSNFEEYLAAR